MWISKGEVRIQEPGVGSRSLARLLFPVYRLLPAVCCLLSMVFFLSHVHGHLSPVFAAGGLYEVREIKSGVFVWLPEDIIDQEGDSRFVRSANAGFILTQEGVIVVDTTNNPFHARELLYEVRRRTDAPVKYVINTASGGDHTLGNEVFVDQQAVILSTSAVLSAMRHYQEELKRRLVGDWRLQVRMRGIHLTPPTRTFDGETSLSLGQEELKLSSPAGGPVEDELVVFLPAAKTVFLGDIFDNEYFPRIGSRDVRRWIETLRQVETWEAETFVPAHGNPGGKEQLAAFRRFLEWLTGEVESRVRQGKTLEQVKQGLGALDSYHWHAPELAAEAVEAVYKQAITAGRDQPLPAR